jgi:hypothetical protein
MKNYHYIIYISIVATLVLLFSLLFNFYPRPTYSELENRELKTYPKFTLDSLLSGAYTSALASWYSDSEPYRDSFLELSMEFDRAKRLVRGSSNEEVTFIAGDDSSDISDASADAQVVDSLAVDQGQLVDSLAVKSQVEQKAKIANHGIVILGSQPTVRAMTGYAAKADACNAYARMVNRYQSVFGPEVQVYCLLIPTAIEFYCPEKARSRVKSQRETIDTAYSLLDSCVVAIDAYSNIAKHTNEDIYLRTDHHWAPLGAYYAAEAIAKAAGVPFKDLSHYEQRVVKRYVGSMFRYSGDISVKRSPEDFVYHIPQGVEYNTTYISYIVDENFNITGSYPPIQDRYFYQFNDGSGGAYCTFMGGDNKITQVRTATNNGRRMLLLKDSFGNAIPGYLFFSFEEIHIVDARYFTRNIVEYVKQNGITDLVFGNNVTFATSAVTINAYGNFLTQRSR